MSDPEDPYLYPDTDILINKFDIKNYERLQRTESRFYLVRRQTILLDLQLTPDGFRAIHSHLFQDIYSWAGEDRSIGTAKINDDGTTTSFPPPVKIAKTLDDAFTYLDGKNCFKGLSKKDFAKNAAFLVNWLNFIHPFREGNGRTLRLFLKILAFQAGHDLSIKKIRPEEWMQASIEARGSRDETLLATVILKAISNDDLEPKPAIPRAYRS